MRGTQGGHEVSRGDSEGILKAGGKDLGPQKQDGNHDGTQKRKMLVKNRYPPLINLKWVGHFHTAQESRANK